MAGKRPRLQNGDRGDDGGQMARWSEMGSGARAGLVSGGVAVAAVAGALVWYASRPAPDVTSVPAQSQVAATPEPAAAPAPAATPEPAPEAPASTPAAPEPPTVDVVRIEPDGEALVAGQAAADSTVAILVDGAEAVSTKADASGKFVAMFTLPPSEAARLLTLVMRLADGTEVPGKESIAVAPTEAPEVAVAAAEPAAPVEPAGEPAGEPEAAPAEEPAAAPEPEAPAALLVTEDAVKVIQGGDAAGIAPEAVVIDSIAYEAEGAVRISGRGMGGALVRLYLDDAFLAETPVAADGQWSVVPEGISPGLHRLRADQLDATGKVISRFETPFKREDPAALEAAMSEPAEPAAEPAPEPAAPEPAATEPAAPEAAAVAQAPEAAAEEPPAAVAEATPEPAVPAVAEPAAAPAEEPAAPAAAEPATPEATAEAEPAPPAQEMVTITVQPGHSLWKIARDNFGEGVLYVQLFEANKEQIRDPDLIYPGQVFTVPALKP